MLARRLCLSAGIAFIAGALCAWEQKKVPLVTLLNESPGERNHAQTPGHTKVAVSPLAEGEEKLFSKVLSAVQGGVWLKQRKELSEVLDELTADDLAILMERAQRLPSNQADRLLSPLFERWFELDPAAAWQWLRAHPAHNFHNVWTTWARLAPEAALAVAHDRPGSSHARGLLNTALQALAGNQMSARAAKLAELPSDPTRDLLLSQTMDLWAQTDAPGAVAFAMEQPAGALRNSMADAAFRRYLQSKPADAAKLIAEYLPHIAGTPDAANLACATAGALATKEPHEAIKWLEGIAECDRQPAAYSAIARGWAKLDPLAALEWSQTNGVEVGRGIAARPGDWPLIPVLSVAMQADPEKTLQWIQAQPDTAVRDAFLETALTSRSKLVTPPVSPENARAVAELLATLPPESQESVAYQMVYAGRRESKVEDVAVWLNTLRTESTRAAAIEAAVKDDATSRRGTLESFTSRFPEGYQRDAAIRGFAASQQPSDAARTALQISNANTRELVLDNIVSEWLRRSPAEAHTWLKENQSQLPPDWQSR